MRDLSVITLLVLAWVPAVEDERARREAQELINQIEQYDGYILTWLAAGPYSVKGKDGPAIFDVAFEPAKARRQAERPGE